MNVKEMSLGGWSTALLVLVAVCSLGNEPFGVLPFLGVLAVVMIFTCGVRAMMLCSTSDKKNTDWKALGCYGIGAAVSVAVPAVMMMFVFG